MKRYIIIIVILLGCVKVGAQSLQDSYKASLPQVISPSPQSQLFERYINHEITEYNGLPEINIPLHSIQINGLTIPLTLSYHASGVKFEQYPGDFSYNWNISAGGFRVNRTVYGKSDFYHVPYNKAALYEAIDKAGYYKDAYLTSVMNWGGAINTYTHIPYDDFTDGEFDQFFYSTPSSSSHFLLTDRRKVNKNIEIYGVTKPKNNLDKIDYVRHDSISITNNDGFQYYYGGKGYYQNPYGTVKSKLVESAYIEGSMEGTAWPLKKIVSPYNEVINFKYDYYDSEALVGFAGKSLVITEPALKYGCETYSLQNDNPNYDSNIHHNFIKENSSPTSQIFYIQQIETDKEIVKFIRNGAGKIFTSSQSPNQYVKEIQIINKYTNSIDKQIKFNYKVIDNGDYWCNPILSSIEIYSKNNLPGLKYHLDYHMPSTNVRYILYPDWWDYLKDDAPTNRPLFYVSKDFKNDTYLDNAMGMTHFYKLSENTYINNRWYERSENSNKALHYFSLKKITFPTGGTTEYEYEPNQYNGIKGGGQRIKRIVSKADPLSSPVIASFKYGINESGDGVANFNMDKELFADESFYFNFDGWDDYSVTSTKIISEKPLGDANASLFQLLYPQVTVYKINGTNSLIEGKIISDYDIGFQYDVDFMNAIPSLNNSACMANNYIPRTIVQYKKEIKPLISNRRIYNVNNKLVQEEKYNYSSIRGDNYIEGVKIRQQVFTNSYLPEGYANNVHYPSPLHYIGSHFNFLSYQISMDFDMLSSKTTTLYNNNGLNPFKSTEIYEYDSKNRLKKTIQTNSVNGNLVKEMTYPLDNSELVKRNMVSTVTETVTSHNNKEVGRIKTNYPSTGILPSSVQTSASGINGLRTEITYDLYDSKGNIRQYTTLDGVNTTYLWSYGGQYPIAEIKGVAYEKVRDALGGENEVTRISNSVSLSDTDIAKINNLRSNITLGNILVTTYTYKPLVGILTATNPQGVTTYYDYDSFGRLKETYIYKDGIVSPANKQILQSHQYHYQNQ